MFKGVKVHFVVESIKFAPKRTAIWQKKVEDNQGEIQRDPKAATHIVVEDAIGVPDALLGSQAVSVKWLEGCIAQQKLLPTEGYVIDCTKGLKRKREDGTEERSGEKAKGGPLYHFKPWLGWWEERFNQIKNTTELVLQAKFDISRSKNEDIVARLLELYKFECAIMNEHDNESGVERESGINHKALQYARAASVVRACAYKITGDVAEHDLPFVAANARIINEIAKTGTCVELQAFRSGEIVHDSKGRPRPETLGADFRLLFIKLPGVGVGSAKAWWEQGFRSYEDVEAHALEHGHEAVNGKRLVTKYQLFSLQHREDLLEHCPPVDIAEMKSLLCKTLQDITGNAWEVWLVGGERRNKASHDADFVVSNPEGPVTGVIKQLVDILISQQRMVPSSEGLCLVQGRGKDTVTAMKHDHDLKRDANNLLADRHDRVVGMYITKSGKYRRMDVIMPQYEEMAYCLISWTGSKQYNRFLRTHATNRGMHLNAHGLAIEKHDTWLTVPEESEPIGRNGQKFLPNTWIKGKKVTSERDVFDLLEVPWREAWERNCQ